MTTTRALLLASMVSALAGCGGGPAEPPPAAEPAVPAAPADEFLPRPFTAEQIRDTWREGLQLTMRSASPEGEFFERWTVTGWDEDGAQIEFAPVDAAGNPTGEPRTQRSAWTELRDHASFPAATATREEATRETPLGTLDGWLYTVPDPATGTVSEFFFAKSLPGAPVEMRVTRDGAVVMELQQVARQGLAD